MDASIVETAKIAIGVAIPTAAIVGGVAKAVLNGTAARSKEAVRELKEHRADTRQEFQELRAEMKQEFQRVHERQDKHGESLVANTVVTAALEKRVESIEGQRWRRRNDPDEEAVL